MEKSDFVADRRRYYEEVFGRRSDADWDAAPGKQVVISAVARWAQEKDRLNASVRLCDLGCGSGYLLNRIRQEVPAAWEYAGVDFARNAIEIGRRSFPEFEFVCEDASNTSFPSARLRTH